MVFQFIPITARTISGVWMIRQVTVKYSARRIIAGNHTQSIVMFYANLPQAVADLFSDKKVSS
jgi:hypothetical protein